MKRNQSFPAYKSKKKSMILIRFKLKQEMLETRSKGIEILMMLIKNLHN